jgi:kynurenine formamidase
MNLITPEKRVRSAAAVKSGRLVSLSRPVPKIPSPINPCPAEHYMRRRVRDGKAGFSLDYVGLSYHGRSCTHLDALCHVWEDDGMWNGRDPDDGIGYEGALWGDVENWGNGIVTRGVLLDVPRHRGVPYVMFEEPVHGSELAEIAREQGVVVEPGDAVAVYCGREKSDLENPMWGGEIRPGLHASCLKFLRETDTAILLWDMLDLQPNGLGIPWNVHAAIWAFGVALVDNALLEPLADVCAEEGRYDFQFSLAPLRVAGGTGSPVNPLALL